MSDPLWHFDVSDPWQKGEALRRFTVTERTMSGLISSIQEPFAYAEPVAEDIDRTGTLDIECSRGYLTETFSISVDATICTISRFGEELSPPMIVSSWCSLSAVALCAYHVNRHNKYQKCSLATGAACALIWQMTRSPNEQCMSTDIYILLLLGSAMGYIVSIGLDKISRVCKRKGSRLNKS